MSIPFQRVLQNHLSWKLRPIGVKEFFLLEQSPIDAYVFEHGLFKKAIFAGGTLDKKSHTYFISKGHTELFVRHLDYFVLQDHLKDRLLYISRSLSMGDIFDNLRKQSQLLTANLEMLYQDPLKDELLTCLYQGVKNMALALMANPPFIKKLYFDYLSQKHFFMYAQPMLSSLLLLAYLKANHIFSDKETEMLFITSYFKDVGMSYLPTEHFTAEELSSEDRKIIQSHPEYSHNILKSRVPLNNNYLTIIANHHLFNQRLLHQKATTKSTDENYMGVETMLVSVTDALVAIISERPYRKESGVFKALEMLKETISQDYPLEFRALVLFIKNFFGQ